MIQRIRSTGMLASVKSTAEVHLALEWGADIIDLKDPANGALGALPLQTLRDAVAQVAHRRPVSATIGDLPAMQPKALAAAAAAVAATGVDFVKVGFFPCTDRRPCLQALASLVNQGAAIIIVLFADYGIDVAIAEDAARHGMTGIMLDTAAKEGSSLRDMASEQELDKFLRNARSLGLLTGLAGSLCARDVSSLLPLRPDYLGFRGGLCVNGRRGQELDKAAFSAVRAALPPLGYAGSVFERVPLGAKTAPARPMVGSLQKF